MQFIVGRVVIIGNNEVIHRENYQFSSVIFVIKKKMDGVVRNICFECVGKLADEVLKLKKDDKVEVCYLIDSRMKGSKWYTNLKAKDVIKIEKIKKKNESQLNIEI